MLKKYSIIKFKSFIIPYCALCLLIIFVLSPETSFKGASNGLNLWLFTVLPSQLPFFILTGYLLKTNLINSLEKLFSALSKFLFKLPGCSSFALLSGIIGGYPLGAKTVVTLRQENKLSKNEAEQLLMFTSFSSPLFMTAAVSTSIFGHPEKAVILLFCHIISGLFVGLISRFFYINFLTKDINSKSKYNLLNKSTFKSNNSISPTNYLSINSKTVNYNNNQPKEVQPIGKILADCIRDSFQTIFLVGGFIIFFAVIIEYFNRTKIIFIISKLFLALPFFDINSEWLINSIIGGFFEMTNGIYNLATYSSKVDINQLFGVAAFLAAWGGLSVHLQVASILSTSDLRIKPYIIGKLLHAMSAGLFTYFIFTYF